MAVGLSGIHHESLHDAGHALKRFALGPGEAFLIFPVFVFEKLYRKLLVQKEMFKGILVPIVWSSMAKNTKEGFELMNSALKKRAEEAGK